MSRFANHDPPTVNLTILEDLLTSEGYEVLTAGNGVEALEIFLTANPPPKLVLLDVTLPDMTGHEVGLGASVGLRMMGMLGALSTRYF